MWSDMQGKMGMKGGIEAGAFTIRNQTHIAVTLLGNAVDLPIVHTTPSFFRKDVKIPGQKLRKPVKNKKWPIMRENGYFQLDAKHTMPSMVVARSKR